MMDYVNRETEMYDLINNLESTRLKLRQDKFTLKRNLSELDYQIRQAKDEHTRNSKLFEDHVISEQEYIKTKITYERLQEQRGIEVENQQFQEENTKVQVKQLEGTLERTRRNLDLMKNNLENLYVKAPVGGLLSAINVEVGQASRPVKISDRLTTSRASKCGYRWMRCISPVFFRHGGSFEFNGGSYQLMVNKVYPKYAAAVLKWIWYLRKRFRRESAAANPSLYDSSSASLSMLDCLPRAAFSTNRWYLGRHVVNPSGASASKRSIRLGRKNPQYFEILEGLEPGEGNHQFLREFREKRHFKSTAITS